MKTMLIEREFAASPPFDSCSRPKRRLSTKVFSSARSHFQKNCGR
jgi:hypothetical protein